jgi:hypothetical protein
MKFNTWLTTFCMLINANCVFGTAELREAWKNGKTAKEVAKANDALAAEYAEVGDDSRVAA